MTTNRTNRRAEDFDRALTADGPAVDPTMAALVAVAGALAAIPQRPAPAFRDALRTRLMTEAASMAPAASVPAASVPAAVAPVKALPRLLQHPAMQVATGGLATAVAATGIGVGASRSLPGDPLYGVKRMVESWQVGLAGGAAAQGMAILEHAQTRVDELRSLLERDAGALSAATLRQVRRTLAELEAELQEATTKLLAAARDGSQAAYDALYARSQDLAKQLAALQPALPAEVQDLAATSLATLNVTRAQLTTMPRPDGPSPSPAPSSPSSPDPTRSPTTSPSTSPTTRPTDIPTDVPTSSVPTDVPTDVPTSSVPTITPFPTLSVTLPPLVP